MAAIYSEVEDIFPLPSCLGKAVIHHKPLLCTNPLTLGPKKRKYPVSGSRVDGNALLMSEVRREDRKATVTQITTRYSQDIQNTISECTTRRTLKQMGYSSWRSHRVPLLSAKNRKRRLQFAQVHQNRTIENWKNVPWSDESRFLLWHSDGRIRIWRKEHERMIHPTLSQRFRLVLVV